MTDDDKRDRDLRLMKYAEPVLNELLAFHSPFMALIEHHAGLSKVKPDIKPSDAARFAILVRDYESAMIGEMIRAMPDVPAGKFKPPARPTAKRKPHPWRVSVKPRHNR